MRYGHFDDSRREYVVTRPDTPRPWSNYLGSTAYGAIITNHAGGYSFYQSGATGRFLRLRFNGMPLDQPGRYFYLRDRASGDFWSAAWQPVGKPLEVRTDRGLFGRIADLPLQIGAEARYVSVKPADRPKAVDVARELHELGFSLVATRGTGGAIEAAGIPVAMPTVLSVTMAVGARLLARRQAIVSRLAAVEELAGIDVPLTPSISKALTADTKTTGAASI